MLPSDQNEATSDMSSDPFPSLSYMSKISESSLHETRFRGWYATVVPKLIHIAQLHIYLSVGLLSGPENCLMKSGAPQVRRGLSDSETCDLFAESANLSHLHIAGRVPENRTQGTTTCDRCHVTFRVGGSGQFVYGVPVFARVSTLNTKLSGCLLSGEAAEA